MKWKYWYIAPYPITTKPFQRLIVANLYQDC